MDKSLGILMVAMHLDYRIHGGLSRHTYELCKALDKLGCQVYVSCIKNDLMNIKNKIKVSSFPPVTFLDFLSFNMNLLRKTRDYDIDVVHSQGDSGFIFALMKRKPLVVTAHTSRKIGLLAVPKARQHPSPYLRVLTEKYMFMKADKVIVVSTSIGKFIQKECGVKEEKIVYIPNAVDVERFNPNLDGEVIRKKYNVDGPLLLCVTRLERGRFVEKLIPMVKTVAREIPNVKLIIVGDGLLRRSLERLRGRYGLTKNVILVGAKDDNALPYFYAAADLYVLPMVFPPARKEFSVLEAMASGKAVIYVNRMGCDDAEESISNGNPIPAKDDKDFARSIVYLLQDEEKRKELGSIGRKAIVDFFSWEKVAEKTVEVYKSLI